jgi:hypothetical protein
LHLCFFISVNCDLNVMTPEQIKSALKICHLPPDDLDFLLEDVITESLSRILASVCKDRASSRMKR